MAQGQEMFYDFFMERVKNGREDEAKASLEGAFARQAAGTFDIAYLQEKMPQYFALLKPEAIEEVKQAMEHFASTL